MMLCLFPHPGKAAGKEFIVVLDAGHGGKDPGTIGSVSSHKEKDIAFNITMEVGRLLKKNHSDIKVVYTRQTDVFVELGRRAEIANKAKADLFVSIHVNALPKNATHHASGVQSYTLSLSTAGTNLEVEKRENSVIALEGEAAKKYNYNASAESKIVLELMQDRDMKESVAFAKLAQNEMVRTGGRKDMGVKQANLAVLRLTYMPSVLLEVGYISTPAEENFLMSNSGQMTMANCIYRAISKYKDKQTGKQPTQEKVETLKPETPQPADTAKTEEAPQPVPAETAAQPSDPVNTPMYRVQILAGSKKLKANDKQFKGLKVDMHQEGGTYKYTYGAVATMQEAKALRKSVLDKFPQAFIVQY
jgi:N-acetylmuramoyl-L-alanine amidase